MWKKRLIAIVTFLTGLYFFLEFVVPATIPWKTVSGVVQSASTSSETVKVGLVKQTGSVYVNDDTKIWISTKDGKQLPVISDVVKPGNVVSVESSGKKLSGIAMPATSAKQIVVGDVFRSVDAKIDEKATFKTLIRKMQSRFAGVETTADKLQPGDWVQIGPSTLLSGQMTTVNNIFIVLPALAWGMGLLSLWVVHSANIRKRRPEWYISLILFGAIIIGAIAGWGASKSPSHWTWMWNKVVFNDMLDPMGSTVFSLLTFYLASAAYRAFKAKSREAALMMGSALIIMLGQISINQHVTVVSQWILYYVNSAAVRGLMFGMMLGGIAIGLRLWLSLERGAFFDREF